MVEGSSFPAADLDRDVHTAAVTWAGFHTVGAGGLNDTEGVGKYL